MDLAHLSALRLLPSGLESREGERLPIVGLLGERESSCVCFGLALLGSALEPLPLFLMFSNNAQATMQQWVAFSVMYNCLGRNSHS